MRIVEVAVENKNIQFKLKITCVSLEQLIESSNHINPVIKLEDRTSGIKFEIPLDQVNWLQNYEINE